MSPNRRLGPLLLLLLLAGAAPAAAQSLYWIDTDFPAPKLGKANLDGTSPQQVPLVAGTLPEGLALDPINGYLYWTDEVYTNAGVHRANLGLAGATSLLSGGSSLRGIDLDLLGGRMYWTSSDLVAGGQIHRANLDGSNPTVLLSLGSASNPRGIAVDGPGNRIYWADYDLQTIQSADLNGAGVTLLANTGPGPWGVALDPNSQRLFWTEYVNGTINQVHTAGGVPSQVRASLGNPTYLAIDPSGGKMYWTEAAAGAEKVRRANLDGSSLQDLPLPLATYGGIAVGASEPTATLLLMLVADAVPAGIEVRWQYGDPALFPSTLVQRADAPGGPWTTIPVDQQVGSGQITALDRDVVSGRTYQYQLLATRSDGTPMAFGPVSATAGSPVTEFALSGVSPNPTNGPARVDYSVAREVPVRISILDVQGREMARLVDGSLKAGRYQAVWSGEAGGGRAPNGLYFVRYQVPGRTMVRRLVLAR